MDLLVNDLSVHEQFHDMTRFREGLSRMMAVRRTAKRYGREVYCHRALLSAKPMVGVSMQQAIGSLGGDSERRAVMSWLTRGGPFWDDARRHGIDDWLECANEIVTDTSVGEAAFRMLHGVECGLVSFSWSRWNFAPIDVIWRRETEDLENQETALENWWCEKALTDGLETKRLPIRSWNELGVNAVSRFAKLRFAEDCFAPLAGIPFAKSAADRFLVLLEVLNQQAKAFEDGRTRKPEDLRTYQAYFTGDRALFSDSSRSEKRDFRQQLTFAHPDDPQSSLFCTWHGKVSHLTLRLHFSWPIEDQKPVYVIYAGPKITKR